MKLHSANFDLIINILIGIRRTVSNLAESTNAPMDERTFRKKVSTECDWVSKADKDSISTIKFIDYAPKVFQRLRKRLHVTEESYIKSLGPE
jgi:1-phosphatidylinositol-4-phosphate 5-kinase